jgi:hypothetical protein
MFHAAVLAQAQLRQPSGRQMFSAEEDKHLRELVAQYGERDWKQIVRNLPNRTARQCRERYKNYLSPELTTDPWTEAEDDLLRQKYVEFGPKWAKIARSFKGRSDVSLKNRWASINIRAQRGDIEPPTPIAHEPESIQTNPEQVMHDQPPADVESDGAIPTFSHLFISATDNVIHLAADRNRERRETMFPNYGGRVW